MKIGFGEIGLTLIVSILVGYIVHRFKVIYDRRKREKNIPKKMEARVKRPVKIGGKDYKLDPVEMVPEDDISPEDLEIPKPHTSKPKKPIKKKKVVKKKKVKEKK